MFGSWPTRTFTSWTSSMHQVPVSKTSSQTLGFQERKGGCIAISSEYLLSRPFTVANLYTQPSTISKKVSVICYTRDKHEFTLSAFRYFFKYTPTILSYLRFTSQLNDDIVFKKRPETAFLIAEACNNFGFFSAGISRELPRNESLLTIKDACGLRLDESDRVTENKIPEGFKNFDIVSDFLKRAKLDKKGQQRQQIERIHANPGPNSLLVNPLLHYQLTEQITAYVRLPDNLASTYVFQPKTSIKEIEIADQAAMNFFRIVAEHCDSQTVRPLDKLQRAISCNTIKKAAFKAVRISASANAYKSYNRPLHIAKDLVSYH